MNIQGPIRASRATPDLVWNKLNADHGGELKSIAGKVCRKWKWLTVRQSHIAALRAAGFSNGKIAETYKDNIKNVDNRISRIRRKLPIARNENFGDFINKEIADMEDSPSGPSN
jgi:DNA-binding CsgD family transcriptional regulator